ncbi:MAG: ring-opening amidohydrolase [Burkholderiales bacterium]|nr:ring-opening amidohydrolase [Burkholderiales bacterium]
MRATVHRFTMRDPGDVSQLADAIEAGTVDPATIVAVIGKTEGNGLVNDFTRGYLVLSLKLLLAARLGVAPDAVARAVIFVFSGGTEGVLTPHYTVFCVDRTAAPPASSEKRLAIGRAFTPVPAPEQIGTRAHVAMVADAVRRAMAEAGIVDAADVQFVQVKGGCVTTEAAQAALARGARLASSDPNKSMAYTRVAGAFGVMQALGEIAADAVDEAAFFARPDLWCGRASVSSGIEVAENEVVVFGNAPGWSSRFVIAQHTMDDALDINGVYACLDKLGIAARGDSRAPGLERVACALVKCEPDARGLVRGQRHTMWQDGDINAQRHIRGAVGGLVAGVLGDTRIFVSGGAEHQGPPGGGLVALIARTD